MSERLSLEQHLVEGKRRGLIGFKVSLDSEKNYWVAETCWAGRDKPTINVMHNDGVEMHNEEFIHLLDSSIADTLWDMDGRP